MIFHQGWIIQSGGTRGWDCAIPELYSVLLFKCVGPVRNELLRGRTAVENPYGGFRSEMGDFGRSWNGRGNPNLFCLNGSFVGVVLFTRHGD